MHLLSKNLILGVSVITITLSVLSLGGMLLAYWATGMIIISEEQAVRRMMETGIVDQEKARALVESTPSVPDEIPQEWHPSPLAVHRQFFGSDHVELVGQRLRIASGGILCILILQTVFIVRMAWLESRRVTHVAMTADASQARHAKPQQ